MWQQLKVTASFLFTSASIKRFKELADPKVREALRWAVDYDSIIGELLSGNAIKVQTLIPQGLLGNNADAPFQQNVEKSKALLKEAGL